MSAPGFDISAILRLLPHRYPFLLIDRILEVEPGERIRAILILRARQLSAVPNTGHYVIPDTSVIIWSNVDNFHLYTYTNL